MKRSILLASFLVGTLSAAGCSATTGDTEAAPTASSKELIKVHVAETAGVPAAFLTWGVEQGYFEQQGLDLEIDTSVGGAAAIPGIVGGSIDIAGSNVVSVILAASKGLPIKMIAPGTFGADDEKDSWSALLVKEDSDIEDARDLAGKTIAVNTLQNIGDVTIKSALEEMNVETSDIKFIEIGFPDMLAALESGDADAVWEIEPFMTSGIMNGDRPVLFPYVQARPGLQIGSFAANESYVAENSDVVEAFRMGIEETVAAFNEDPDSFRAKLPELARVPEETAKAMHLPTWKPKIDEPSLTFIVQQMLHYEILTEDFDLSKLLLE